MAGLRNVAENTRSPRPLMRAIAGTLESETEKSFAAQGRPAWLGLSPRTLKKRGAGAKILQDTGRLAGSVASRYGRDFASIGSNVAYAAIHQFGGTINRAPYSSSVRLRTDAKGKLLRQSTNSKLAVFAKDSHRRAVSRRYTVGAYGITIPARPFLPADKDGRLQPAAARAIESDVQAWLRSITEP
nr:phage virion morphogenesis protein [Methyloversatilis sp. XJ19-13]